MQDAILADLLIPDDALPSHWRDAVAVVARPAREPRRPARAMQLLRDLIDRVEMTPDRRAYPYFWVPASCGVGPTTNEQTQNAQPVSTLQGDTGWLFVTSSGGGGNRTRVLRLLNGPSPSAAGGKLSGAAPLPAATPLRIRLSCP
jgi:hypothetical protein